VNDTENNQDNNETDRTYEVLVEINGAPETIIIRAPHPEEAVRRCSEQLPQALVLCVVRQ
jgi:hypothetical protein